MEKMFDCLLFNHYEMEVVNHMFFSMIFQILTLLMMITNEKENVVCF